jgi:hypothetical protein
LRSCSFHVAPENKLVLRCNDLSVSLETSFGLLGAVSNWTMSLLWSTGCGEAGEHLGKLKWRLVIAWRRRHHCPHPVRKGA